MEQIVCVHRGYRVVIIRKMLDDAGHGLVPDLPCRRPAVMSGNNLILPLRELPHQQGVEDAVVPDGLFQLLQPLPGGRTVLVDLRRKVHQTVNGELEDPLLQLCRFRFPAFPLCRLPIHLQDLFNVVGHRSFSSYNKIKIPAPSLVPSQLVGQAPPDRELSQSPAGAGQDQAARRYPYALRWKDRYIR